MLSIGKIRVIQISLLRIKFYPQIKYVHLAATDISDIYLQLQAEQYTEIYTSPWFQTPYAVVFLFCVRWLNISWEFRFVNIGGIVDRHCVECPYVTKSEFPILYIIFFGWIVIAVDVSF